MFFNIFLKMKKLAAFREITNPWQSIFADFEPNERGAKVFSMSFICCSLCYMGPFTT